MFPLPTQLRTPPIPISYPQGRCAPNHAIAGVQRIAQRGRGEAAGGAHGEVGGLVDSFTDLDEVVEDGGIDGLGARGEVVAVGEGLEDFGGELEPGPVEGRDVAPMSAVCALEAVYANGVYKTPTYLLRHMIRADVEGSFAGFLVDAVPFLEAAGGAFAGVTEGLVAGSSVCALFFLRAIVYMRLAGGETGGGSNRGNAPTAGCTTINFAGTRQERLERRGA